MEVVPFELGPDYGEFYIPLGERPEIVAVEAVEKYNATKKILDAVVWLSNTTPESPERIMKILGFSDPDEVVDGEIVDEEAFRREREGNWTPPDHDHSKCCRYNFCAHPMCCGYRGEEGRQDGRSTGPPRSPTE